MRFLFTFFGLVLVPGAASACMEDGTQLQTTDTTAPAIYAQLDQISVSQPFGLRFTVCGVDDLQAATIMVDAWMPKHQHGMNYSPTVRSLGNGRYEVSNMLFNMPADWQLRISLPDASDSPPQVLHIEVK